MPLPKDKLGDKCVGVRYAGKVYIMGREDQSRVFGDLAAVMAKPQGRYIRNLAVHAWLTEIGWPAPNPLMVTINERGGFYPRHPECLSLEL